MANVFKRFLKGIALRGETSNPSDNIEGSVFHNSTDQKIRSYVEGAVREFTTNDQTQTLTNKTIDADLNTISDLQVTNLKAGVLDTDLTTTSGSDDTIPSAKATKTYVDDHINDPTGAHAASAVSNIPAGNLAATDVQGALDELQGDVDTNASAISNHISDAVDAHDASAISNVPSGNLAATDVQSALDELQSDVDGRATTGALSAHTGASSGVHGVVGSVVGTTDTQTLTNKTIDGDDNTIQDVPLSAIKTVGANTNRFITRDGSGVIVDSVTLPLSLSNGGTGQTTQTPAFDALSPNTSKGDLIVHDGTNNIRVPVGANDFILTADSTVGSGVKWAAAGSASLAYTVNTYTTTQTLSATRQIANVSAASPWTLTLPNPVGNSGLEIVIKRTDNSLANVITISGTIDGQSDWTINTQYEAYHIISNNVEWKLVSHETKTPTQDAGALTITSSSHYVFTLAASASITLGTVFTSNGNTFYVSATTAASTTLNCYGTGSPGASGTLTYSRGPTSGNRTFNSVSTAGAPVKGSSTHETFEWTRNGNRIFFRWDAKWAAGTAGTGNYAFIFPANLKADSTNAHLNYDAVTSITGGLLQTTIGTGFHSSSISVIESAILGDNDFFKIILPGNGMFSSSIGGNLANAGSHSIIGSYIVSGWKA